MWPLTSSHWEHLDCVPRNLLHHHVPGEANASQLLLSSLRDTRLASLFTNASPSFSPLYQLSVEMTVRFILQFSLEPSHALTVCEPWTRWLVETERPNGRGHVIGDVLCLRKTQDGGSRIITTIEVEQQLEADLSTAQQYLQAHSWWLHRAPFGVERLPVKLIVNRFEGRLITGEGWHVVSLQLRCARCANESPSLNLASLRTILATLDELNVCCTPLTESYAFQFPRLVNSALLAQCLTLRRLNLGSTDISDLTVLPLGNLEALSLAYCDKLTDVRPLSAATRLTQLDLMSTKIASASVLCKLHGLRTLCLDECYELRAFPRFPPESRLEVLSCRRCMAVSDVTPLSSLSGLRTLDLNFCHSVSDITPLARLTSLEHLDIGITDVADLTPLLPLSSLRTLVLNNCKHIANFATLSFMTSLEELTLAYTRVNSLSVLCALRSLCTLDLEGCEEVDDFTPLADLSGLVSLSLKATRVTDLTPLQPLVALRTLNVERTEHLQDLSPLAGAPALETLHADASGVTTVAGLHLCPHLTTLHVAYCKSLMDLSSLATAPALREIDAGWSAVTHVRGLDACPRLAELVLHGTPAQTLRRRVVSYFLHLWDLIFPLDVS